MVYSLSGLDNFTVFLFVGFSFTAFLLFLGFILKITKGLLWARTFKQFKKDQYNWSYQKEREVGLKISRFILMIVPPFFLVFLLLIIWFHFK